MVTLKEYESIKSSNSGSRFQTAAWNDDKINADRN